MKNLQAVCFLIIVFLPLLATGQQNDTYPKAVSLENRQQQLLNIIKLQDESYKYISTNGAAKTRLDSAYVMIETAEKKSLELKYNEGICKSLALYAFYWRTTGQKEKAKTYAENAVIQARRFKLFAILGQAYQELYEYYDWYSQLGLKTEYLEKAINAFKKSSTKKQMADILTLASEHYNYIRNNSKAIEVGEKALALYKAIGEKDLINIYRIMGYNYTTDGNYKKALEYSLLGARYGEVKQNEPLQMGYIYSQIASIYHNLKEPDLSREYLLMALENAKKSNDITQVFTITTNIVHNLISLKKYRSAEAFLIQSVKENKTDIPHLNLSVDICFTTIYMKLKDFKNAEKYCREMMALVAKYHERLPPHLVFNARHTATNFYYTIGNYATAKTHLLTNIDFAENSPGYIDRKTVYISAYKIDSAMGNYKDALNYYQKIKGIDDSIFNIDKNKQLSQLQLQYETEKKDHNILLKQKNINLLTKEAELEKEKTEKANFVKNITFIGCAVLLLVAALLYKGYKQKQRINIKLEKQRKQISLKNISLGHLIEEKEWLLKEIHHRVKNNLQIVMSLLNSQSIYLEDKAAIAAIRDSQHRVHSMSLIHQKLYQSDNMAAIAMQVYIKELTAYLKDSFDACDIIFNVDVDPIELDVSQAVPIGLILNEAITNAIKYAFKEKEGTIKIALKETGSKQYQLLISDNGTGLPNDLDSRKSKSLGMNLMQGLSGDIDGKFEIYNDSGTTIKITFGHEFFDHLAEYDQRIKNN